MAISTETSPELAAARQIAVRNPLREKLDNGELAHSLSVKLVSSIEIVGYAAAAGYDAILVDLEHSAFGLDVTNQLSVSALQAGQVPPPRSILDFGADVLIA